MLYDHLIYTIPDYIELILTGSREKVEARAWSVGGLRDLEKRWSVEHISKDLSNL